MEEPTIFARASGQGRSAVAVIRISGTRSAETLHRLAGRCPVPRHATLVTLRDPSTGEALDRALALWFPGPRSFTGEDAAELHLHGGPAVVGSVLKALAALSGLRPAAPGEFTRRAFRHGKMDLAEVEALADLIDAETDAQRRQALRQLDGALGIWVGTLREALLDALALAEAVIDFAEEDDLAAGFEDELKRRIAIVTTDIDRQLVLADRGGKLRDGLVVAIAGPPNVGKSTLLNRLAGREVAIVSAYAGTTRDAIEVDLDLDGSMVRLIDTAGLRDTADPIEQEGIARARARAAAADVVLWLDDASLPGRESPPAHDKLWTVATKVDVAGAAALRADFTISARTGQGIDALVEAIAGYASRTLDGAELALITRLRHRQGLLASRELLSTILDGRHQGAELIAENVRGAIDALSSLLGRIETEEVLGTIFARFCIGK